MKTNYDALVKKIVDPRVIFLNYGSAASDPEQYGWIREEDYHYRYHLNLVRRVLGETPTSKKNVLEVGCGRGGNCFFLARYAEAELIYGVDRSPENVRFCRTRHVFEGMNFLTGDAESLPLRSASFDVVLNLESAHCYDDFGAFLGEVHRVLRPGGVFCFADLWGMRMLPIDWNLRESLVQSSPLSMLADEDITREVVVALEEPEGMAETLPMLRGEKNDSIQEIIRGARKIRWLLASGECSYRMLRFAKA